MASSTQHLSLQGGAATSSSSSSSSSPLSTNIEISLGSATRRLNDVRSFQLPRLRDCRGPLGMWNDMAEELRGDLEGVRRNLELAREMAESLPPSERLSTLSRVDLLEYEVSELRIAYREAIVVSKREMSKRSGGHELKKHSNGVMDETQGENPLEADSSGKGKSKDKESDRRRGDMGDDALQTKTHEVTDALRRTTTLMQAELERSVVAVQTLDQSTQTLRLTQSLYDNYTSLLQTSGELVKAIEKADWYDRLVILAAFVLFLLVVGWVIKRRVLDKVVGGVGWWVGGSWKLVKMGMGGGRGGGGTGVGSVMDQGMDMDMDMAGLDPTPSLNVSP